MARDSALSDTVLDPQALSVAEVYAEALLSLKTDNAQAEELAEELQKIVTLLDTVEGMEELLAATTSAHGQVELVGRVFAGRCSEVVEGLLASMARNQRLSLLRLIANRFRRRLDTREGCVDVMVTTAVALDEAHRRLLTQTLQEITGAKPLLRTKVNPALVGGVVVRIADREYDGSVAGELKRIRQRLRQVASAKALARTGEPREHEAQSR
jgi:F-type H+-transporting ATPase subunit delta